MHERRMAAVEILTLAAPRLGAGELAVVERLVRESGTWALVDGLAGSVAGEIALRDPRSWPVIDGWAVDADFWVRRSALLALLRGIRGRRPDLARFTRYAEPMLAEREFFIRKAIGWVLREISKHDPAWVASWTELHLAEMSGVTFREAVRRLPGGRTGTAAEIALTCPGARRLAVLQCAAAAPACLNQRLLTVTSTRKRSPAPGPTQAACIGSYPVYGADRPAVPGP